MAMIDSDSSPPSGKPRYTLARFDRRGRFGPLLLDRSRREEEHFVRRHRRAEQRDRPVEVRRCAFPGGTCGCGASWNRAAPVGAELPHRDREHDSARPTMPNTFSIDSNLTRQITIHTSERHDRDPQTGS